MSLDLQLQRTAGAETTNDAEIFRQIAAFVNDQDDRLGMVESDQALGSIETLGTTQVADFTLNLGMAGETILCNKASELVVTIPSADDQPFEIGTRVKLLQFGAGDVRVVAAGGVTLDYTGDRFGRTRQQWGALSLLQIATNHWVVTGDLDYSVQDISSAHAIDLYADHVRITGPASSTYAVTLAAPVIGGRVKVIEMVATTSSNTVTLALTNVIGGTAATTCTFSAANHILVLVSAKLKWVVLKQQGVTLT